jgi:tetratricopeptide (TPR) repeat protein
MAAADRLRDLVPGAGHLVHMPSHIYMRVGRYQEAADANVRAVAADRAYIEQAKPSGIYPMMYYPHNIDFLQAAASMDGRSADALRAAQDLAAATPAEMIRQMPDVENGIVAPLIARARFGHWEDILKAPAPPKDLPLATGLWHYVRGLALTRAGRHGEASEEQAALDKLAASTPATRMLQTVNTQRSVLLLAARVLEGERAAAQGQTDAGARVLEQAVEMQDALRYMEPPPWYYPVRQSLGAVLLAGGRAPQAEAVYRDDLARNPENGWSLHGLAASLRAQKKHREAARVEERFQRAWRRADVKLEASRF